MAQRRILITGGSGFVGQWLCRLCLDRGDTVIAGTTNQATGPSVLSDEQRGAVEWASLDTTSDDQVQRVLDSARPDAVVHLAAMAFSPDATESPARAFEVNALGAMRLLAALDRSGAKGTRVLIVGSAEQYGANSGATPLNESVSLAPLTMYAASKAAQELIALQAARGSGVQVVCTRSFNHSGFGHGPRYLFPSLVERARALGKDGGQLRLGNTSPVRDYLHVGDVVSAYAALLERGVVGEVYNVCSGIGTSVGEIAARVLKRMGVHAEVGSDPALIRPVDVPILVGDNSKLRNTTGWSPRHTIDDIIDDLINGTTR